VIAKQDRWSIFEHVLQIIESYAEVAVEEKL